MVSWYISVLLLFSVDEQSMIHRAAAANIRLPPAFLTVHQKKQPKRRKREETEEVKKSSKKVCHLCTRLKLGRGTSSYVSNINIKFCFDQNVLTHTPSSWCGFVPTLVYLLTYLFSFSFLCVIIISG